MQFGHTQASSRFRKAYAHCRYVTMLHLCPDIQIGFAMNYEKKLDFKIDGKTLLKISGSEMDKCQ